MRTPEMITRDHHLLELELGSSKEEIELAYQTLLLRYAVGSLASYGLFRIDERHRFLTALEGAYHRLTKDFEAFQTTLQTGLDESQQELEISPENAHAIEDAETPESLVDTSDNAGNDKD